MSRNIHLSFGGTALGRFFSSFFVHILTILMSSGETNAILIESDDEYRRTSTDVLKKQGIPSITMSFDLDKISNFRIRKRVSL